MTLADQLQVFHAAGSFGLAVATGIGLAGVTEKSYGAIFIASLIVGGSMWLLSAVA